MSKDLIHKRTRDAFREYLVNWEVLRSIRDLFNSEYIECNENHVPIMSGERRRLVEQYYSTLDFSIWRDVQKFLCVIENVFIASHESAADEIEKLKTFLLRDGFIFEDGRIVTTVDSLPTLGMASEVANDFDAPHMLSQIRRMEAAIDAEPDLAIGSAKELLETCCKTILSDRGIDYDNKAELSDLIKAVQKELKLLPDDVPDAAKGAQSIKRMLSNLGDIVRGMAEIRNLYGSGHGKHGRASKVKPRHAKLAVGAATTLVVFLFETHRETLGNPDE